jgi:hypothetical protein
MISVRLGASDTTLDGNAGIHTRRDKSSVTQTSGRSCAELGEAWKSTARSASPHIHNENQTRFMTPPLEDMGFG